MGFLDDLAQAWMNKERMRLGVPQEERAQEAHDLAAETSRRNLQLDEAEAPIRAAERQARTKKALADTAYQEGRNRTAVEIAEIRARAARELNPERKRLLEAQAAEREATAGLQEARTLDPAAFRSSGGASIRLGRPYPAQRDGEYVLIDPDTRQPIPGLRPMPTADMRNVEFQSSGVAPTLALLRQSLDDYEQSGGDLTRGATSYIPNTDSYYTKRRIIEQAAMLGTIAARQAGDNRLSDADRTIYTQAATLANGFDLAFSRGIDEARRRLADIEALLSQVQEGRREVARTGRGTTLDPVGTPPPLGITAPTRPPIAGGEPQRPPGVPANYHFDPSVRRWRP
jgi:hypothetical protein